MHGSLVSSRNWYAALPTNKKDWDDLKQLVAKGFMFEGDNYLNGGLYFHCTPIGVAAANLLKPKKHEKQPIFHMLESRMKFKKDIENGFFVSVELLSDGFASLDAAISALEEIGLSVKDITKTDHPFSKSYVEGRIYIVKLKT